MYCLCFDFLLTVLEVIVIVRLVTYGTSNISRYLIFKHGKRLEHQGGPSVGPVGQDGPSADAGGQPSPGQVLRIVLMKYWPLPCLGVGLFGFWQWRYFVKRIHPPPGKPREAAKKWEVTVYTLLPLRIMSRLWGTLCSIDLPVFLRPRVYSMYAKSFGVNLNDCLIQDLRNYRNLSEFFIRPLKEEVRPVDQDCKCVVSPADGRILSFGKITSCQVDQVKGVTYSLQQFLGQQTWRDNNNNPAPPEAGAPPPSGALVVEVPEPQDPITRYFFARDPYDESITSRWSNDTYLRKLKETQDTDLYQCVVYLAPGDYHRFHSPVNWHVDFRRHFQGKLLSVNPAIASWIRNLFTLNERACYVGCWEHGFFSLTAVGATNVGSIKVYLDPSLSTNQWNSKPRHKDLSLLVGQPGPDGKRSGLNVDKGEPFGEFRLGSTVVLIFEAPKNFQFDLEVNQKIRYGQRLGGFT